MDLNKAMLIGNLTRDPEVRTTTSGQSVANFSLATNRYWTDAAGAKQSAVEYHNIVAWGRLAEICSQYLKKGKKIFIEGRLQTRAWEGQDGVKRTTTEIVADNMIMLDGPFRGGAPNQTGTAGRTETTASIGEPTVEPVKESAEGATNKDEEIKVEDIPF